jgi:hypothetical protein
MRTLDCAGHAEARPPPAPSERIGSPGLLDSWFAEFGLFDKKAGSEEADLRAALDVEGVRPHVRAGARNPRTPTGSPRSAWDPFASLASWVAGRQLSTAPAQ